MTTDNRALDQANAQMASITAMVSALSCDYDRLEELREAVKAQRSISTGTMRPADLVPAFAHELADRTSHDHVLGMVGFAPDNIPATDDEFWGTENAGSILELLFEALDSDAPEGCYFGAHPGDGSDYGFWMTEEDADELAELEAAAGDCESYDDAEQRIHEDALSVEVRSDWHNPCDDSECPSEFRILLCTGGPAVQIRGELGDHGQPERAWLEYQDWGTPWTERVNQPGDMLALLTYAGAFYFGH